MQKPKGTKDIFGQDSKIRNFIFKTLEEISDSFNFEKIETPIFESKDVFIRSVGQTSDVVSKEMYKFNDKSNRELVLRPEGTAGVIRAVIENKLYAKPMPLKLYYLGPMFRYENPQKGRQRQFTQYGVELMGKKSPYLDSEVIIMAATILDSLQVDYELKINSLGTKETRDKWSQELKKYFSKYKDQLEEISLERLERMPSRILDDKIESKKPFVEKAPDISKFYSKEDKIYFNKIINFLKNFGIKYKVDHKMVRGFDYYGDTAFEFISKDKKSGSQNTIIGGGRYNDLVKDFGGPELSGVGFAIGIERLVAELNNVKEIEVGVEPDIYVMNIDESSTEASLGIVYLLRKSGFKVAWNYIPTKINKAFEKADKTKAFIKIIAGPKELEEGSVMIKINQKQEKVKIDDLIIFIDNAFERNHEKN